MKSKLDLVRSWLQKAEHNLQAVDLLISECISFDVGCFLSQQVAEMCLKGYLTAHDQAFPFTHDLSELIRLCATIEPSFMTLLTDSSSLTPFAVDLRCDPDFCPSRIRLENARNVAVRVRDFVKERLPQDVIWEAENDTE